MPDRWPDIWLEYKIGGVAMLVDSFDISEDNVESKLLAFIKEAQGMDDYVHCYDEQRSG
jgi:hypothetical protein